MESHIIVTGGSGFLGKEICRQASQRNISVVSISRSGKPGGAREDEFKRVTWAKADVFNPETWKAFLPGCTAIIHCVGTVEEQPAKGITYDKMIYASARIVGITAKANGISKLVYISAGAAAPETPAAYMENKKKAEAFLASLGLALVILKPGMLYGKDKPETIIENGHIQTMLSDPHIGPKLYPHRPLPVAVVAKVALQACFNNDFPTKLDVNAMDKLGNNDEF